MDLTLDYVRSDLAQRLAEAASDRHSPMHTPVVVTADASGRIMVLREFDAAANTLRFHTDARAPKSETIGKGDPVGVVFYDPELKLQIRCHGRGRIETDTPLADKAWRQSDNYARRCYLGQPPGVASDEPTSGLPEQFEGERPSDEELAPARANFAVLLVEIDRADWYHLAHDGHRRAVFENGEGRWLTP